MSFAPQNQAPDITDSIDGSITSWYDNINNCLKTSECVPGHYEYAQAPSYGNQCPIQEGGSTKISIECSRFEIISLDNSYIDCEFSFPVNIPTQFAAGHENLFEPEYNTYYIGWKSSYDLIDQYRIYSNGDLIYTQNHSNYEGFLNYISLTDSAKEESPCFATIDKLSRCNQNIPGTYITIKSDEDVETVVTIKTKIPLNAFPVLQNLKYFPGFMGRLEIEVYPSYKNLVWALVTDNHGTYYNGAFPLYATNKSAVVAGVQQADPTAGLNFGYYNLRGGNAFAQINCQSLSLPYKDSNDDTAHYDPETLTVNSSTLQKFHLYKAVYMIKMDVYNALEMNYLQTPLLFPIQTITNTSFTYPIGTQQHFTLQNTATLSHCDTIFIVFPNDSNERTISFNPEIKAHLNINGKYYPRETLPTARNDPRFVNLIHDALNINNNPLLTPGLDIETSICPYSVRTVIDTDSNYKYDLHSLAKGDRSNFVFAVPLSTDEDFMGGISSNGSTVQIELIGDRDSDVDDVNDYDHTQAPVAIFLEDKLLKIYSMKQPGKPQIQITTATLDQIIASGGNA